MIPETTGLLRGSNDARLPEVRTGSVAEDAHGNFVFGELSSPSILRGANDVTGGRQHPV